MKDGRPFRFLNIYRLWNRTTFTVFIYIKINKCVSHADFLLRIIPNVLVFIVIYTAQYISDKTKEANSVHSDPYAPQ